MLYLVLPMVTMVRGPGYAHQLMPRISLRRYFVCSRKRSFTYTMGWSLACQQTNRPPNVSATRGHSESDNPALGCLNPAYRCFCGQDAWGALSSSAPL